MSWESSIVRFILFFIVRFNFVHEPPKQSVPSPFGFQAAHIINLEISHLVEVIFSLPKSVTVGFT